MGNKNPTPGDRVEVGVGYGSSTFVLEVLEIEDDGAIVGKCRESGRAPECPQVGFVHTVQNRELIEEVY